MGIKQTINPMDLGKIPPQAIEAEDAVLGSLLSNPSAMYEIADLFTPEAFYKDEHQKIANAIVNLFDGSKSIDIITVGNELKRLGQLEEVGGSFYVTQLLGKAIPLSNVLHHYRIVFQKYMQREIIRTSSELLSCGYDETMDLNDLLDKTNQEVDSINDKMAGKKQASHISTLVKQSREALKKREQAAKDKKLSGIRGPLIDLDKLTQGWQPGVYVLAARPGQGKTACSLSIGKSAAVDGHPVCFYSLEMDCVRLADRLIMGEADIKENNFRTGYMAAGDWSEFEKAATRLSKLPIYIDDNPVVGTRYIKSHSRIMQKRGLCDILIIDYLQLFDMDYHEKENRERQVAKTMRELKIISKQLNLPIIVLSQLNRSIEGRDKRPNLTNLRESGAIEQDADCVMFIHRPWYYGIKQDAEGNSWDSVGLIIVEKNREGPLGDVKFIHNPSITKIKDWVDPNKLSPQQPTSNRDRQLPPEREEVNDIPDKQPDLPF